MNKGVNIVEEISKEYFHAVNFTYHGREYSFSGWWILDWEDGDKIYDSKEEFLADPVFEGKTIGEIEPDDFFDILDDPHD